MGILDFFRPKRKSDSQRLEDGNVELRKKAAESDEKLREAEAEVADAIECAIDAGNTATATMLGLPQDEFDKLRAKWAKGEA